MRRAVLRKLPLLIAAGLLLSLVPVISEYNAPTQLEVIYQRDQLRVVSRLSPTTYYVEENQPGGFEYELAQAYADHLGVQLQFTAANSLHELGEALRLNNAHLAAAGLARTPERAAVFDFGPDYLQSEILLIYRSGNGQRRPKELEQLEQPLTVVADSNHAHYLQRLDKPPEWHSAEPGVEALDLLRAVDQQLIPYTLADAEAFEASRPFFPRLRSAFALPGSQPVAWMLKRSADSSLQQSLTEFFALTSTQDLIRDLKELHFESDDRLNMVDSLTFRHHLKTRLPKLQAWFEQAADEQGMEWHLLAAIGYQESHWNPKAISPTGVRGVMMLTQPTARSMGVKKRTDAKQSIFGGAKYFAKLFSRIPERITGPDRIWFALGAYNVGRGHLEDARILAQRAGDNPDHWDDVAKHLPKLAQARWYKTVKHGYARGYEPVRYVENIRRYLAMLKLESRYQAIQDNAIEPEIMGPPTPPALQNVPETL